MPLANAVAISYAKYEAQIEPVTAHSAYTQAVVATQAWRLPYCA